MKAIVAQEERSDDGKKLIRDVINSIDVVSKVSNQIASMVKDVTVATQNQTQRVADIANVMETISSATQNVALSANELAKRSLQAEESVVNASRDAEVCLQKFNTIKDTMVSSTNMATTLGEELAKIRKVVEFLTDIADQTNILALNAAIEAARAGKEGRGFAVVAEEVKKLAESSAKGASEISAMVQRILSSSSDTIKKMNEGSSLITENYSMIANVLGSLKEIASVCRDMSQQIQSISASSEELAAGSEEIAANIEELNNLAQSNLTVIENVNKAVSNENETMKRASNSAHTLTHLVDLFSTLAKSSIVSMTDKEGDITYVNEKFLEVSRYSKDELMGENHRILKSGFISQEVFNAMWQTISRGGTFMGYIRNKAKDNSIYWVKAVIQPTFDSKGNIDGYVAVRTPVTELMVSLGVEEAISKMKKGKRVDPKLKDLVEQLRSGTYKIYDNYAE